MSLGLRAEKGLGEIPMLLVDYRALLTYVECVPEGVTTAPVLPGPQQGSPKNSPQLQVLTLLKPAENVS